MLRLAKFLFTALVIAGAVFSFFGIIKNKGPVLVIQDSRTGKVYGKWPLKEINEFAIEFVHSVHQSPVRETFRVEKKLISPVSVRFASFGAGMQSDLDEGQTMIKDGESMVISGFKTSFKALNYIVGTVSDHLLFINGDSVSLRELCGRNAQITINVK